MTQQTAPTKAELLAQLRDGGAQALGKLRALDGSAFEQGRYENGWNGRQILAHLASIEWTYQHLIDLAREVQAGGAAAKQPAPVNAPAVAGTPQIMNYNERQVEKRAGASVAELLGELEENRASTISAVEAADEALFSVPIRSAGGAQGPLASVLNYVAVLHVAQHVNDIAGQA
jgi:hypothetical protein